MKKILKIVSILTINFGLIVFALIVSDFLTYKWDSRTYYKFHPHTSKIPPFKYYLKNPVIPYTQLDDYFNGKDNIFNGRLPVGTEYKSNPILYFGDSYIHGQYLEPNQNFGYKLSHSLKRPVYNRAIPGSGFQHMYYQVSDENAKSFYEQVPPTDTIFYIMIHDHYLRMSIFSDFDALGGNMHLRYTIKDDELVKDDYNNPFLNFLKSSHTIRNYNLKYLEYNMHIPQSADKMTDSALKYFIETRNILEKKWNKKINFNVIFYDNFKISHQNILREKLKANGFKTLAVSDLTNEDLNSEKYLMQDNLHPTEAAWDLLTPLIVEKLELKN